MITVRSKSALRQYLCHSRNPVPKAFGIGRSGILPKGKERFPETRGRPDKAGMTDKDDEFVEILLCRQVLLQDNDMALEL